MILCSPGFGTRAHGTIELWTNSTGSASSRSQCLYETSASTEPTTSSIQKRAGRRRSQRSWAPLLRSGRTRTQKPCALAVVRPKTSVWTCGMRHASCSRTSPSSATCHGTLKMRHANATAQPRARTNAPLSSLSPLFSSIVSLHLSLPLSLFCSVFSLLPLLCSVSASPTPLWQKGAGCVKLQQSARRE